PIGWIVGGALAFVVLMVIAVYNGLVRLKVQSQNAWADIDVQLKRRHDLVPNLVETVKGYAGHERATLEAVIAARNRAVAAQGPGAKAEGGGGRAQRRAQEPVRAVRVVSAAAGRRGLHLAAGFAAGDRGPDRERAAVLQRRRARPEHQDRAVPP